MVDLRQLRQFIAVAEELHFHRAAARLSMSQPPLTTAIRKLEEEIGVELIERGNRTLGLTAAGRVFLDEARQTLLQAERSVAAAQETAAGRTGFVRLGYVGSALYGRLPDAIRAFRESHPEVRLELLEATTAQQVERIREGGMDAGLLIPSVPDAGDLSFQPFDTDRLCIALPHSHALATTRSISVGDLANENFVLWPAAEGRSFHVKVIRLCADAGFVPMVVQEAHGMHAVLSLVAVEAGISIVPQSMMGFRNDRIIYRPIKDGHAAFELSFCFRDPVPNPALKQFLKTTAQPLRRSRSSVERSGGK
ncbi:LysR family transcriptional regulator [Brucella sp. JSBI001]|uniref:LysR family transcriptional regulator n=1 Tax=Brucella sp. JSBI001 TaxID=2886044 RepID=UPI0022301B74|nr:LysR family transcriptional regulator [Brucella sp. JSBI001]UZD69339.1 LysR family transcriptional regulator [Brucella sp. JSBI001]